MLRRQTSFQCGQAELKLVDPVPENLHLGLVGELPSRSTASRHRFLSLINDGS
jgi:hypothetical protein